MDKDYVRRQERRRHRGKPIISAYLNNSVSGGYSYGEEEDERWEPFKNPRFLYHDAEKVLFLAEEAGLTHIHVGWPLLGLNATRGQEVPIGEAKILLAKARKDG